MTFLKRVIEACGEDRCGLGTGLEVDVGYLGGLLLVTADVDLDDFIDPIASLRPYGDSASNSLTNLVFDSLTL